MQDCFCVGAGSSREGHEYARGSRLSEFHLRLSFSWATTDFYVILIEGPAALRFVVPFGYG